MLESLFLVYTVVLNAVKFLSIENRQDSHFSYIRYALALTGRQEYTFFQAGFFVFFETFPT